MQSIFEQVSWPQYFSVTLFPYTEQYGLRVRGETSIARGNPIKIYPDAGSLLKPVTTINVTQEGSGDPYPAGGGKNLCPVSTIELVKATNRATNVVFDNPLPIGNYTITVKIENQNLTKSVGIRLNYSSEEWTDALYINSTNTNTIKTYTFNATKEVVSLYAFIVADYQ